MAGCYKLGFMGERQTGACDVLFWQAEPEEKPPA